MPMNGKIFISYSWSEPSGSIVNNWLVPSIKARNINCLVDKEACGYNANIDKFEVELPQAAKVLLVVSTAFLHSLDCMFEAALAVTKCDIEKQVYVINLHNYNFRKDDQNLLEETFRVFENKKRQIKEAMDKLPDSAKGPLKDEMRKINKVLGSWNALWRMLKSKNSGSFEMLSKNDFKLVCDVISESLKGVTE